MCVVASGGFWRLLAAAKPENQAMSSNLETQSPKTVWKGHRHSLRPFQKAYIMAKGFRVGDHLLSLSFFILLICFRQLDS